MARAHVECSRTWSVYDSADQLTELAPGAESLYVNKAKDGKYQSLVKLVPVVGSWCNM